MRVHCANEKSTTLGSTRAAQILLELVSGSKKKLRKISSVLSSYNNGLKHIHKIDDISVKKVLLRIWCEEWMNPIHMYGFNEKEVAFLRNVMRSGYRNHLSKTKEIGGHYARP